eukprot:TRINITY_DN23026_c0_g1_i1.p1 TRINITY_DN23026_c0_g1~~TRINITY_DN23026_c0_g1_i1.p1  ORF type:complete len:522 (-),score=93.23 TRINITY_DN23026_c0_g1_i1:106-1671(-)
MSVEKKEEFIRVLARKPTRFYVEAASAILCPEGGDETSGSSTRVLRLAAVGSAMPSAISVAATLTDSGLATINSVQTEFADVSHRASASTRQAQIFIVLESKLSQGHDCPPLAEGVSSNSETKVVTSDDGRGHATFAARTFARGDVMFKEPPLAMVYPSRDPPWLADLRHSLTKVSDACAWQYCVAVHCLIEAELPQPVPCSLGTFTEAMRKKLMDLCGDDSTDLEPSTLGEITAEHLLKAAKEKAKADDAIGGSKFQFPTGAPRGDEAVDSSDGSHRLQVARWLAHRLDDIAARVSRNGFQVMDLQARPPTSADGVFHRISFLNHSCAGLHNASWSWNGKERLINVQTTADVAIGDELTITYIGKPWCDLAKPARRRYLKQNYNFVCLCKACTRPPPSRVPNGDQQKALTEPLSDGKQPVGKLASLLTRWMKDEREESEEPALEPTRTDEKPETREKKFDTAPLSSEQRLDRVLQRCTAEGIEASAEEAQRALEENADHVGKAIISLRKKKKTTEPSEEA